ncbi:MAG: hypothetical protein IT365_09040 [Candidatus Hydrogenedentes bacterium]|nr:hypothetical protein [Candidatus Hydrogenedentota bacterium]
MSVFTTFLKLFVEIIELAIYEVGALASLSTEEAQKAAGRLAGQLRRKTTAYFRLLIRVALVLLSLLVVLFLLIGFGTIIPAGLQSILLIVCAAAIAGLLILAYPVFLAAKAFVTLSEYVPGLEGFNRAYLHRLASVFVAAMTLALWIYVAPLGRDPHVTIVGITVTVVLALLAYLGFSTIFRSAVSWLAPTLVVMFLLVVAGSLLPATSRVIPKVRNGVDRNIARFFSRWAVSQEKITFRTLDDLDFFDDNLDEYRIYYLVEPNGGYDLVTGGRRNALGIEYQLADTNEEISAIRDWAERVITQRKAQIEAEQAEIQKREENARLLAEEAERRRLKVGQERERIVQEQRVIDGERNNPVALISRGESSPFADSGSDLAERGTRPNDMRNHIAESDAVSSAANSPSVQPTQVLTLSLKDLSGKMGSPDAALGGIETVISKASQFPIVASKAATSTSPSVLVTIESAEITQHGDRIKAAVSARVKVVDGGARVKYSRQVSNHKVRFASEFSERPGAEFLSEATKYVLEAIQEDPKFIEAIKSLQ